MEGRTAAAASTSFSGEREAVGVAAGEAPDRRCSRASPARRVNTITVTLVIDYFSSLEAI